MKTLAPLVVALLAAPALAQFKAAPVAPALVSPAVAVQAARIATLPAESVVPALAQPKLALIPVGEGAPELLGAAAAEDKAPRADEQLAKAAGKDEAAAGGAFDGSAAKPAPAAGEALAPKLEARSHVRGKADAPHTLVVYSDMNCPDSLRGSMYEAQLLAKYPDDLKIVYKHNPLPMHGLAQFPAAIMEAIAMQSPEKAWKFHDLAFNERGFMMAMMIGPNAYVDMARSLGLDLERLQKDYDSGEAQRRMGEDMAEARSFGFHGTPSYVLDGKAIKGAGSPETMADAVKKAVGR